MATTTGGIQPGIIQQLMGSSPPTTSPGIIQQLMAQSGAGQGIDLSKMQGINPVDPQSLNASLPQPTSSLGWLQGVNAQNKAADAQIASQGPINFQTGAGSYGQQLPLWRQALNQLDRPRNAIDTAINDALTAHQGLLGDLGAGAQGLYNGFMDKQQTDFGNILDTLGWKPTNENAPVHNVMTGKGEFNTNANLGTGLHKFASFLGDVATDPLTYVTSGVGGVGKAGVKAGLEAAAEAVGKDALKGTGNDIGQIAQKTAQAAHDQTVSRLSTTAPTANPDLISRLAQKNASDAVTNVLNAAKGARAQAGTKMFNLNVPFTNLSKNVITKPSFLQQTEKAIGTVGATPVENALDGLGLNEAQKAQVYGKYGVGSAGNLTPQMRDDLMNRVSQFQPNAARPLPIEQNVQQTVTPYTETVQEMQPIDRLGSPVANPMGLKQPDIANSVPNQILTKLFGAVNQAQPAGGPEESVLAELLNKIPEAQGMNFEDVLNALDTASKGQDPKLAALIKQSKLGYGPLRGSTKTMASEVPVGKQSAFQLPKELQRSAPRYGYRGENFKINFQNDLDKATYILANKTNLSKADEGFMQSVVQHTGLSEDQIRQMGRQVKEQIKQLAKQGSDSGELEVPSILNPQKTQTIEQTIRTKGAIPAPKTIIPGNHMLTSGVQQTEQHIPRELFSQTADVGQVVTDPARVAKQAVNNLSSDKFIADLAGQTPVGSALSKAFGFLNPRAGEGTNTAWDALGSLQGRQFNMNMVDMPQYQKLIEKLPSEVQSVLPYLVEGELPLQMTSEELKALDKAGVAYDKATGKVTSISDPATQQAIKKTQELNTQFAQNETKAGTLTKQLPNYYYHMLNKNISPEQLEKLMQNPYVGKSMRNTSNIQRKAFNSLAEWRNAVSGIKARLNEATDSETKAGLQDTHDQLQNLYHTDPAKVMQARYAKSIKTQTFGEMFKSLENQGLVRNTVTDIPNEYKNFTQLDKDSAGALGLKPGTYVHKDVLNVLKKTNKVLEPSTANKMMDNFNGVMNLWKALPIIYSPSHIKTRFMGDVMNAMLGGAKVGDFSDAQDLYQAAMKGTMTTEQKAMWQKAVDTGIVRGHAGQNADIFENTAQNSKIQQLNNMLYNNKVGQASGNLLNKMDNQSRLALFLAGMKTYGDEGKAAMNVKKYLFNYNELTNTEKGIRTVVPFYTWMRNNLPLMVSQLAQNPRYFQTGNRVMSQLNNGQPYNPYAADFLRVPGTNYMEDARLPMQDLDMVSQPMSTLVNSMPFMALPFEQHTNTDFFSGMPIDPTKIAGQPAGILPMLGFTAKQVGAGGISSAAGDALGNGKPLWQNLFNLGIGGLTNQDPAKIQKEANWQQKAQKTLQKSLAKKAAQKGNGG